MKATWHFKLNVSSTYIKQWKTWFCTTFKPFLSTLRDGIRFSITIYRHVSIHAQCQQVAHRHSQMWKTWRRETKRGKAACLCCFGSSESEKEKDRGDTKGQTDSITVHMLGRRSPSQCHWPRNQRMAVTSCFFYLDSSSPSFVLNPLNVCKVTSRVASSTGNFPSVHQRLQRRQCRRSARTSGAVCPSLLVVAFI